MTGPRQTDTRIDPAFLAAVVAYLTPRLDEFLADLATLVAIDSGSDDPAGVNRVVEWLEVRLAHAGFNTRRHASTTVGDHLEARLAGPGPTRVLLVGHADTVYPAGTAAARPMTIQGGRLRGPGTCDMKAGLLAGIYAVEALQALGRVDLGELVYLCVADEEIDDRTSIPLITQLARAADVAFTLEAARANGDIVSARKTMRGATVEAFGRAAHAGVEPEWGRNALVALADLVLRLDGLNGLRPGVTLNVGVMQGGTVANVVPDYARVRLDLRAWSAADMGALLDAIRMTSAGMTRPDIRFAVDDDPGSSMPALERTPAVAALEEQAIHLADALGFTLKGAATGGASDASFVAAAGTPVLDGLGPVGGLDHSPEEYIELASIVPRTALLAGLIAMSEAEPCTTKRE